MYMAAPSKWLDVRVKLCKYDKTFNFLVQIMLKIFRMLNHYSLSDNHF